MGGCISKKELDKLPTLNIRSRSRCNCRRHQITINIGNTTADKKFEQTIKHTFDNYCSSKKSLE